MKNLAIKVIDRLFIVVYGAHDPSDEEWNAYLALAKRHGVEQTVQLICTDGGAPTSAQRRELNEILGGRTVPVAVVSPSPRVRATVTALSWFNRAIKAFPEKGLRDALEYLEIPASRADLIEGEIQRLRRELSQGEPGFGLTLGGLGVPYAPGVIPTALAIAGLDPSGGAGLAADLRSFGVAGVWGAAVCSVITVQSTRGVRSARPVPAALVLEQAREVLADARVRAVKTGALGSGANARAVARLLAEHASVPSVVDPVMLPSRHAGDDRGGLHGRAVGPLRALAAAATLITPNLAEAAALLGRTVPEGEEAAAAEALVAAGARAALVKGGHGRGPEAVDWLALGGGRLVRIARPRRALPPVHGTGCTLASLIAGRLAARVGRRGVRAEDLLEAARWARARLDRALRAPLVVGGGLRVMDVTRRRALSV